jgi:hypothetical protein
MSSSFNKTLLDNCNLGGLDNGYTLITVDIFEELP